MTAQIIDLSREFSLATIHNDVARLQRQIDAVNECTNDRRARINLMLKSIENNAARELQFPADVEG